MSSFKNASKSFQKAHKERHQPAARGHLGQLEKKGDYRKRADDYNSKKAQLQYLQKKALDKNPDEFYYHMINSEIKDGAHYDKSKPCDISDEQVALMASQDKRYVTSRVVMETRKVERLNESLQRLEESAPVAKHTFFVDNPKDLRRWRLAEKLDTPSALLSRRYNRPRTSQLTKRPLVADPESLAAASKSRAKGYKELTKRMERAAKLQTLQQKMEIKAILQAKKKRVKERVAPETKDAAPIYVFKQERYK